MTTKLLVFPLRLSSHDIEALRDRAKAEKDSPSGLARKRFDTTWRTNLPDRAAEQLVAKPQPIDRVCKTPTTFAGRTIESI
jgi:hypothetical protein